MLTVLFVVLALVAFAGLMSMLDGATASSGDVRSYLRCEYNAGGFARPTASQIRNL